MTKEEIFKILYGKEKWDVYRSFQEIESSIDKKNELYNYFDDLVTMLSNELDYIRARSFKLICRLSIWDKDNKINNIIDKLLLVLDSDKPTIVRMCLASIGNLLEYKKELIKIVIIKLENINYLKYKETMQPLIKKDIDNILKKYEV